MTVLSFQYVLDKLASFWSEQGCAVIPSYPAEVGAATFHPVTIFNCCADRIPNLRVGYIQPCVRPVDNRGGLSKNRLYQHHQFQVLIKPVPDNIQDLYLQSLEAIGILQEEHDIKFVEDNWENPSIGAYGIGWEVQLNGMEVTQFTYMSQVGGITCPVVPVELAYGLERIVMLVQNVDSVYDIVWNKQGIKYKDFFWEQERQFAASLTQYGTADALQRELKTVETAAVHCINAKLPLAAYQQCLRASHILNVLDANGVFGYNDRAAFILRIKDLVRAACELWSADK